MPLSTPRRCRCRCRRRHCSWRALRQSLHGVTPGSRGSTEISFNIIEGTNIPGCRQSRCPNRWTTTERASARRSAGRRRPWRGRSSARQVRAPVHERRGLTNENGLGAVQWTDPALPSARDALMRGARAAPQARPVQTCTSCPRPGPGAAVCARCKGAACSECARRCATCAQAFCASCARVDYNQAGEPVICWDCELLRRSA